MIARNAKIAIIEISQLLPVNALQRYAAYRRHLR